MSESSAFDLFQEVHREERLSDKVADALQQAIVSGQLRPGERLPPERALGERFAVSRTVIREAVRSLVAKGLVDVTSGSGSRVAPIRSSAVTESMSLYLRAAGQSIDYSMIHEVRELIEVHASGLAAERSDADDLEGIRSAQASLAGAAGDVDSAARSDVEFHRMVARATHNALFVLMLDSIGDALLDVRRATLGIPGRPEKALQAHDHVLEAIAAHDVDRARAAMENHLLNSRTMWSREDPEPPGELPR